MKRLFTAICCSLVLAGLASQAVAARSTTTEAAQVRAQLLYEVRLTNQARWRPMWRTYSPRVRSHCSYNLFVSGMSQIRATCGPFTLRKLAVRVRGRHAFATYEIIGRGKVVGGAPARRPDVFVRIDGRWFDEFDADGDCP
jgi:hypothetical protein